VFLDYLRKFVKFVAITCCGVLILTVVVAVVLRYLFGLGLAFSEDLPRYLMVVVTFLGAALALDAKQHINIRLFVDKLSSPNQLRLELFYQVCIFAFLIILIVQGIKVLPIQAKTDIPTMRGVSLLWFYVGIPLGCVFMTIFLIPQLLSNFKKFRNREALANQPSTNSIWSIAFICFFAAGVILSLVSFYSGSKGTFFYILASCFAFTVAIGMPVAFCLGIPGVVFFLISKDLPLMSLPTLIFGGISPFALMAITAFILTGLLVERSGVVQRLVRFADTLVGHLRGGLAHTNIVANMFMAGISGAALADCAAIGAIMIPAMKQGGYDKKFAVALNTAASVVGPIIPPSVGMIIYAYAAGGTVTIGGLFMSGAIPGVILGLGMMAITYVFSVRRNYPVTEESFKIKEVFVRGKGAFWGLMIPALIVGGILGGVFTPTEAGAIAAAYGLFVGVVVTRRIKWKDLTQCLFEASKISGVIFLLLGNAKIITYILTLNDAPATLTAFLQSLTPNPYIFIILVITLLLLLGFVMEGVAIMIMLVPVLAPAAQVYGIEPHHFGLIFVMAIQLAILTPPVALGLFISCSIADATVEEVMPDVWPFLFLLYGMICAIAFFPEMTLWLPKMLGYVK
jgi:C4-dicarboxylate transporter DctM subunit